MAATCPRCKREIPEGSRYCEGCGAPVRGPAMEGRPVARPDAPLRARAARRRGAAILLVLALGGLAPALRHAAPTLLAVLGPGHHAWGAWRAGDRWRGDSGFLIHRPYSGMRGDWTSRNSKGDGWRWR